MTALERTATLVAPWSGVDDLVRIEGGDLVGVVALGLAAALLAIHLASILLAYPYARRPASAPACADAPPVTVVRVLCGLEPTSETTVPGTLDFEYPDVRPIFCVARADDPVAPLVREAMAARPDARARLLIGEDRVAANPKLNNMVKAWRAADTDLVLFLDSNLSAPPDYVARAVAAMGDDVAASAPPIGTDPRTFAADVEAACLNTHAARWQYAAAALGLGFAQGKTLLLSKSRLPLGDLSILGREPAEDAALTCLARGAGGSVALIRGPAGQSLGRRSAAQVWRRQARWAKLRRATFPALYVLEITAGAALPLAAAALAGARLEVWWLAPALAGLWWGAERVFARLCGWPGSLPALVVRDLAMPALWVSAWWGDAVSWRDARVPLDSARTAHPEAAPETRPGLAARQPGAVG